MTTAIAPLLVALVDVLEADVQLGAEIAGVYAVRAPERLHADHIVVGTVHENERNTFGREGHRLGVTLHLWTTTERVGDGGSRATETGHARTLALWRHVRRLLHQQRLAIAGHMHRWGNARLVTVLGDPSGAWTHGVVEYRAVTATGAVVHPAP